MLNEPISRKEAKAKGLTRYLTLRPCPRGHIAERSVKWTCCLECKREDQARRHRSRKVA